MIYLILGVVGELAYWGVLANWLIGELGFWVFGLLAVVGIQLADSGFLKYN